jgi:hypothetical protein
MPGLTRIGGIYTRSGYHGNIGFADIDKAIAAQVNTR